MVPSLARSFAWCERLARRAAGNFNHAFRLLPLDRRRAMCALYAFNRIADDLADGPAAGSDPRGPLLDWQRALDRALRGDYTHPIHPALHATVQTYAIPRQYLDDVLEGVGRDLGPVRFETFAELYRYCYLVASAVGLTCIHVWGFRHDDAKRFAEKAGIALQLTNILRDLGEDAARGRIYLPREDLERFGYSEEALARGQRDDAFRDLMRFEVGRARGYYAEALPLAGYLDAPGRAVFLTMLRTYRAILDEIERRDYDVFGHRVTLGRWHKLYLAAQALPVRWGWT